MVFEHRQAISNRPQSADQLARTCGLEVGNQGSHLAKTIGSHIDLFRLRRRSAGPYEVSNLMVRTAPSIAERFRTSDRDRAGLGGPSISRTRVHRDRRELAGLITWCCSSTRLTQGRLADHIVPKPNARSGRGREHPDSTVPKLPCAVA
jgi:hypothetical protein